jgi:hypothetical protein
LGHNFTPITSTTHHTPPTKYLEQNTPFGFALKDDVDLDPDMKSGTEGYIDDMATTVLNTEEKKSLVQRATASVLRALHLQFRPNAGQLEPILRPEAASRRKLLGEGGMAELIIFLGWLLNTRAFMIPLPKEKAKAWSESIQRLIDKICPIHYQELATLVGGRANKSFGIHHPTGSSLHQLNPERQTTC